MPRRRGSLPVRRVGVNFVGFRLDPGELRDFLDFARTEWPRAMCSQRRRIKAGMAGIVPKQTGELSRRTSVQCRGQDVTLAYRARYASFVNFREPRSIVEGLAETPRQALNQWVRSTEFAEIAQTAAAIVAARWNGLRASGDLEGTRRGLEENRLRRRQRQIRRQRREYNRQVRRRLNDIQFELSLPRPRNFLPLPTQDSGVMLPPIPVYRGPEVL